MESVLVTLPDGSKKEIARGMPISSFVKEHIGIGLAKAAIVARLNGELVDLSRTLDESSRLEVVTSKDHAALEVIRHDAAHVLASAVQRLYPGTKVTIGPVVEDGFYYDFARDQPFTPKDLEVLEKAMSEEIAQDLPFERFEVSADEAVRMFQEKNEPFKVEVVLDIKEKGAKTLTMYRHGEWVDFCLGPHGPSTGKIGAVKLLKVAGAYWRGNPKNPMLQRIYGTAFLDKKSLENHLHNIEEAKKRDHRKLGPALELFTFHEYAPGAAFWLPKGTVLLNVLTESMRKLVLKNGYSEVKTPLLLNKRLWETSGHWGKYRENMFLVVDSETDTSLSLEDRCTQSLKPMNCPSHHLLYRMSKRSYRELPIRYYSVDVLHRNEASGTLSGLTRVRQFQQDDAHVYLMEEQVRAEVSAIVNLMKKVYTACDLPFRARFSTRPQQRIGEDEVWDRAEAALQEALEVTQIPWELNPGDGAFYGPKIDFDVVDSLERRLQLCTIQLDYAAPERFDLTYIGPDNREHRPVIIHRAIFGSLERFAAILLEHFAGVFPVWLAPVQVRLVTVTERHEEYARQVSERLSDLGMRVEVDASNEKLGAKIRQSHMQKIPFTCVVGDNEVEQGAISPRRFGGEDLKSMKVEEFVQILSREASVPFLC